MIKNCYIHIPFCKSICSYCDFCKVFYNKKQVSLYLTALKKEIKSIYKNEVLETIYVGGGTPSSLSIDELEELFDILSLLKKDSNIEFTVECNFSTITLDKLKMFKKYGVNRLSFGIESVSSNNLKLLGRKESRKEISSVMKMARNLGFSNINLDLMYAIPGENLYDLDNDLDYILSLDPEHISTYSLMIEKNTKLYIDKIKAIDEDLDYLMYNRICSKLRDKYRHYEISNFSKCGYESKHNLCYWHNKKYYGFGVSASSYRDFCKYTNTKSITKYIDGKHNYLNEKISTEDDMSYQMILGLRLIDGVSKEEFRKKYGVNVDEVFDISDLLKNNLLYEDNSRYYISEDNLYISNEILLSFIKE